MKRFSLLDQFWCTICYCRIKNAAHGQYRFRMHKFISITRFDIFAQILVRVITRKTTPTMDTPHRQWIYKLSALQTCIISPRQAFKWSVIAELDAFYIAESFYIHYLHSGIEILSNSTSKVRAVAIFFLPGGQIAPGGQRALFCQIFAQNCMKNTFFALSWGVRSRTYTHTRARTRAPPGKKQ
jgi:hypothetical protein